MLGQAYIYGFSVSVVFGSEAQCADNGRTLGKRCNEADGHHGSARWVGLSTPMDCVAPLGKGVAIPGKARLAMNVDRPTEPANISLTEH